MSIRKIHLVRPYFAIFLLSVLSACTHIYKPPTALVSGYEHTNIISLKVGLVLNDELHNAKWEYDNNMGDVFRIPLGDSLTKNSETLIRKLFADVVIGASATEFNPDDIDVIVKPTMISAEQTSGNWHSDPIVLTVFLEWRLQDSEGQLVWVDTIKGEGIEELGTLSTHKSKATTRIKKTLDDLFKKSHKAISSSLEIKDLVNKSRD